MYGAIFPYPGAHGNVYDSRYRPEKLQVDQLCVGFRRREGPKDAALHV